VENAVDFPDESVQPIPVKNLSNRLLGPVKWSYFYLYVIMDIFSRYGVGWMIAPAESAALAKKLIQEPVKDSGLKKVSSRFMRTEVLRCDPSRSPCFWQT